jgi:nicotinamidase-related amidase
MAIDLGALLAGAALPGGRPQRDPQTFPAAVLTMELQRGVVGDLSSFPELAEAARHADVLAHTAALLAAARTASVPVVHCTAEFRADRLGTVANTPLHTAVLRRPGHLLEETPATELTPALGPVAGDLVSSRCHGVSPFTGTSLDATLRNLGAEVLVVTGVSVNLGVFGLCVEAVNLGYQVVLVTDAVAGLPADYAAEVVRRSLSLIATLATTAEVVALLNGGPAGAASG